MNASSVLHTANTGESFAPSLRFSEEMIDRLRACGVEEVFKASTSLFIRGDRNVDMFVVLDGEIEVFESTGRGDGKIVAVLTEGQFTGELDLLDGRQTLLDCRTLKRSRVLRINRAHLQRIMRSNYEIADLIMRASIGRRFDIVRHGSGGVLLIGQEHSADTIRLQRFLTRNGYPYRLLDAEKDPDSLIRDTAFVLGHLPVVLLPNQRILSNPSNALLADELGLTDHAIVRLSMM